MAQPLRIATLGAGYFSRFHFDGWERIEGAQLVALCNRSTDKITAIAEKAGAQVFDDLATMLAAVEIDILDVITPPETHLDAIKAAAPIGIDVICQKPFCTDLETARLATQIAEDAGIELIIHENFRFQPWYPVLKSQIASERLGDIYQATFRLRPGDGQGPDAYLARQPYFQKMQRFMVHETAIHLIDVMRYLLGEAVSVQALLSKLNPVIAGEDAGLIVMQHESGARSVIDGNRLVDHAAKNTRLTLGEMMVEGADGVMRLTGDGDLLHRRQGETMENPVPFHWRDHGFGADCVYEFQRHVIDHFASDAPVHNRAHDYLRNLEIEDAVYRSHEEGRRIEL